MPPTRPSAETARSAIRKALARGRRSPEDVAQLLYVSRSTLERGLQDEGLKFKQLRREEQLKIAIELLTAGTPAAHVADEVCMTRDHLRVTVREHTGRAPNQIIRAARLADKARGWSRYGPPAFGSARYRRQFHEWKAIDAELQRLLADLGHTHPLAAWAKKLLVAAHRPDFRQRPHRARLRERQAREAAASQERLDRLASAWMQSQLPHENRSLLDIYFAEERRADAP